MKWRLSALVAMVLVGSTSVGATARPLPLVGKVSVDNGVINDAFALDDSGHTLAWVETTGSGSVRLHVGPASGGRAGGAVVDLTEFTVSPERIHYLGGQWIVVANEGERRAAAVVSGRRLAARIGPFGDGRVSGVGGKKFVTVTEKSNERTGRSFTIAAYRPGGDLVARKQLTVSPEGEIAGTNLGFIGFVNGYLQVLVKKPGEYDRRSDARAPSQVAVYDVLAGRTGAGKRDIGRSLDVAAKRSEQPGAEMFVRRDGTGLELLGPDERIRPLALPLKMSAYENGAISQQVSGGRLIFSLVRDAITEDPASAGKRGDRALAFFSVEPASGKLTALGEVPLAEGQDYAWAAGGSRLAVLRKTPENANAGPVLEVYQR
jgi:hypothetical protein